MTDQTTSNESAREFWIDTHTEWAHTEFPEHLTKEPHQHEIVHTREVRPGETDLLTEALELLKDFECLEANHNQAEFWPILKRRAGAVRAFLAKIEG